MKPAAVFRFLLPAIALAACSTSYAYGSTMYVFVTIDGSNGDSANASMYNALVTEEAASFVPAGESLVSCAMVSTTTESLLANCAQVISDGGDDEVLNLDNGTEIADSFDDLLTGPFLSAITQDDGGPTRQYWTGSTSAGVASADPLGGGSEVTIGTSEANVDDPLDFGLNSATSFNNVLGLVVFVTPESSTGGTVAIGCFAILLGVWRAQRRRRPAIAWEVRPSLLRPR